jgi:soluble lytic murein transglycosylase
MQLRQDLEAETFGEIVPQTVPVRKPPLGRKLTQTGLQTKVTLPTNSSFHHSSAKNEAFLANNPKLQEQRSVEAYTPKAYNAQHPLDVRQSIPSFKHLQNAGTHSHGYRKQLGVNSFQAYPSNQKTQQVEKSRSASWPNQANVYPPLQRQAAPALHVISGKKASSARKESGISEFIKVFSAGSAIALLSAAGLILVLKDSNNGTTNISTQAFSVPAPVWSESVEEMLAYQQSSRNLPPLPPLTNVNSSGLSPAGNYVANKPLPADLVFNDGKEAQVILASQVDDPRLSKEIDLKKGFLRKVTQQVYSVITKHAQKHDPIELTAMIVSESIKAELDPLLVAAVIRTESAFNPKAVSPVGAQGLMQIMPATKNFIENMEAIHPQNRLNIFTPRYNIKLGIAYLKYLKETYKGNMSLALMAYNWGPGHISKTLNGQKAGVPHSVLRYALKILDDHGSWYARISNGILFE